MVEPASQRETVLSLASIISEVALRHFEFFPAFVDYLSDFAHEVSSVFSDINLGRKDAEETKTFSKKHENLTKKKKNVSGCIYCTIKIRTTLFYTFSLRARRYWASYSSRIL